MIDTCDIVVTGLASLSAAGIGTDALRDTVAKQASCLLSVPEEVLGESGYRWGKAEGFKASDFIPPLKARRFDRSSLFAVVATGMALKDAGFDPRGGNPERAGIALGCGFGGIGNSEEFLRGYFTRGTDGLVPMLFPNTVPNAPASNASIEHGLKGPNTTQVQRFCSAESALHMACRFLQEKRADLMVTGGVDELNETILQGFRSVGQLRRWGREFGEGCGILVLERASTARERGARIHGSITGIRTLGRLLPGREDEGAKRLFPEREHPDLVSLSGVAGYTPILRQRFTGVPSIEIGPLVGFSLGMGGNALVSLFASLPPGRDGLHIAASPEGPYFAIGVRGGDSVQS